MNHLHVVIVGGGFAGLHAAQQASHNSNLNITLIDRTNHHLFQPLLYQVATAALAPSSISYPLREIFRHRPNVTTLMGEVVDIRISHKYIVLRDGQEIPYDVLILATGARHSYFQHPEWENSAPGLKNLQDALNIRERVLMSFEMAERLALASQQAPELKKSSAESREIHKSLVPYLRFVIIGGGPTGVEMAGSIAELAHHTLHKNFRGIDPNQAEIILVEGSDRILPYLPPEISERARRDLERMGVKVLLNKKVTKLDQDGPEIDGEVLTSKNMIWAAGNQASPLLKKLGVPLDRQGRVIVQPNLSLPQHPEIFVLGDAAACMDEQGRPLPAIAPVAIQQGKFVGQLLKEGHLSLKELTFRYRDKGNLATIGRGSAVGVLGKTKVKGFLAWILWGAVHIIYLIGFRNRYIVLAEWFFHYLFGQRGARILTRNLDRPQQTLESTSRTGMALKEPRAEI